MPPPSRIYLESSALRSGGWPTPKASLEALLNAASELGVALYIPDAVDQELEAQWVRGFVAACATLSRGAEEVARLAGSGSDSRVRMDLPPKSAASREYRRRAEAAFKKFGVVRSPLSGASLQSVFSLALEQTPPFSEKGGNFKDAVILLSVVEHLADSGDEAAVLVANDGDFRNCRDLISDFRVQLEVLSLDSARSLLTGLLDAGERAELAQLEQQVRRWVEHNRGTLEEFLLRGLRVPVLIGGRYSTLATPLGVHLASLNAVILPPTARSESATHRATLQVGLALHVRGSLDQAVETLLSERAADIYDPAGVAAEAALREAANAQVSATADVEAEVSMRDGQVTSVKFLEVDLRGMAGYLPPATTPAPAPPAPPSTS